MLIALSFLLASLQRTELGFPLDFPRISPLGCFDCGKARPNHVIYEEELVAVVRSIEKKKPALLYSALDTCWSLICGKTAIGKAA